MSGWICSHRKIWDHPLFAGNAQRVGAWHWMLHMAAIADTRFMADGQIITLQRGQLCVSQQQFSDATGMTRKQVRTFLEALEGESAVVTKRANDRAKGRTVVTICNYDKYQHPIESEGPSKGQAKAKQGPTKEQSNKENNNTPLPPKGGDEAGFEAFWAAYPHRPGAKKNRKGALAKWNKLGVTPEVIMAGVERMKADPTVARGYARDAVTWLNQEGWTDEVAVPKPGLRVVHSGPRIGDVKIINGNPMEYAGNGTGWIRIYA